MLKESSSVLPGKWLLTGVKVGQSFFLLSRTQRAHSGPQLTFGKKGYIFLIDFFNLNLLVYFNQNSIRLPLSVIKLI